MADVDANQEWAQIRAGARRLLWLFSIQFGVVGSVLLSVHLMLMAFGVHL